MGSAAHWSIRIGARLYVFESAAISSSDGGDGKSYMAMYWATRLSAAGLRPEGRFRARKWRRRPDSNR